LFAGFLPAKSDARKAEIAALSHSPATLIWFEAARRLPETLAELHLLLGERPAAVVREITKRFEESRRGMLSELAAHYAEAGEPKGEVVVLVGAAEKKADLSDDAVRELLQARLREHRVKDAASIVAAQTGLPRKQVYALALALEKRDDEA
jgi:16S rRNA (cytidine1402-2'-O)-methyltransferase